MTWEVGIASVPARSLQKPVITRHCVDCAAFSLFLYIHTADDQLLAAYVALEDGESGSLSNTVVPDLLELCRAHLPSEAVPAAFQVVKSLPESAAGKLDRSQLPFPRTGAASAAQFAAH